MEKTKKSEGTRECSACVVVGCTGVRKGLPEVNTGGQLRKQALQQRVRTFCQREQRRQTEQDHAGCFEESR